MNIKTHILSLACVAAFLPATALATTITGVNAFGTDSTGAAHTSPLYWSTQQGGFTAFVTSIGFFNTAAVPDLNLLLTPGLHVYAIYMDNDQPESRVAMNLYFNGNGNAPDISLLATPGVAGFVANTSPVNLALGSGAAFPSAGKLTFNDGSNLVTVTGFTWVNTNNSDQVSPYAIGANGINDAIATITLTVTPTPEPASALLLASGLGMVVVVRRLRSAS